MHPLLGYTNISEDTTSLIEDEVRSATSNHQSEQMETTKAEIRKSNKPIMEKRRRARINNCLNDLKGILLEAMKKDPARHSKLEKADILELTVRHLQTVQRNQLAVAMATDPTVLHRFKNGFAECTTEVSRYLTRLEGIEPGMKQRLSNHLNGCVNGLQQVQPIIGFEPQQSGPTSRYFVNPGIAGFQSHGNIPFVPPTPASQPPLIVQVQPQQQHHHSSVLSGDVNNNANSSPSTTSRFTNSIARPHLQVTSSGNEKGTMVRSCDISKPNNINNINNINNNNNCTPVRRPFGSSITGPISPIDFSLKVKESFNHSVRILKVEPLNKNIRPKEAQDEGRDSMWRPW